MDSPWDLVHYGPLESLENFSQPFINQSPELEAEPRRQDQSHDTSPCPIIQTEMRKYTAKDWVIQRQEITKLYSTETLETVMKLMREQHGLDATAKQYKDRIKKWALNKNIQPHEMEAMIRIQRKRAFEDNKRSAFRVRKRPVDPQKIKRYMRDYRLEQCQVNRDEPLDNENPAATPGAISCYTPSDIGSPNPDTALSTFSPSASEVRRVSLLNIKLPYVINGVETEADRVFFKHYIYRLSSVLSSREPGKNPFKEILLPLAAQNPGVMHSILALASSSIDYKTSYGASLLAGSSSIDAVTVMRRSYFHEGKALAELRYALVAQEDKNSPIQNSTLPAIYCQMICLILQSAVEKRDSECLMHLKAAKSLIQLYPPDDGPLMEFINEYTSPAASAHEFPNFGLLNTRLSSIQGDLFAKSPYSADSQRD